MKLFQLRKLQTNCRFFLIISLLNDNTYGDNYDDIIVRGDTEKQSFAVFYIKDNAIIASDCVNRPAEHMMSRKLISEKILIDKNRLSDETIPIKEVAN